MGLRDNETRVTINASIFCTTGGSSACLNQPLKCLLQEARLEVSRLGLRSTVLLTAAAAFSELAYRVCTASYIACLVDIAGCHLCSSMISEVGQGCMVGSFMQGDVL